jgi:ATP-dependent DNA ligase
MIDWLPTLFKRTSTGQIQVWRIGTDSNAIHSESGKLDGKMVAGRDVVKEGKNTGKVNATTPEEQARAEAEAKFLKQLKKGYTKDLKAAQQGEVDTTVIEGGVNPMLAHKYRDHAKKIVWPAAVQPKLDGIRCIGVVKDGKATLWSRTRKQIKSMPHIEAALVQAARGKDVIFDGELYNHNLRTGGTVSSQDAPSTVDFEQIISLVRKDEPDPNHKLVEYHVYDLVLDNYSFADRSQMLRTFVEGVDHLVFVETIEAENHPHMEEIYAHYMANGYEGAIVRNLSAVYEYKRSYNLQKVKEFVDEEFEIVGIEEGRGKLAGHAGAMVCVLKDKSLQQKRIEAGLGETFNAKMEGNQDRLRYYFENPNEVIGKLLTVRFQNLTQYGVPRFPVGARLRDQQY